jgi:CheY-like chemotaxis protein
MTTNVNIHVRHILLVEDDPRDAKLTLAALAEHNVANKVFHVTDGEQALDYLNCEGKFKGREGGNPVAILLDLKMPKVDGLEVLKVIKNDENLKTIPVVVLTSSREPSDLTDCYGQGVNAYVVKPVDFAEFAKAVGRIGGFWVTVNEPPPIGKATAPIPGGEVIFSLKKKSADEIGAKS